MIFTADVVPMGDFDSSQVLFYRRRRRASLAMDLRRPTSGARVATGERIERRCEDSRPAV